VVDALAIRRRALGPDHPDTVATRRALAELAAENGDPPAERLTARRHPLAGGGRRFDGRAGVGVHGLGFRPLWWSGRDV
jgi:hypothetical protein